ncbi:hypothetical protein XENTR_v10022590 [Xenopus tropicalis]|nr:hypothetical protein XENTR_v10022590 [Xenopus tropicalis]
MVPYWPHHYPTVLFMPITEFRKNWNSQICQDGTHAGLDPGLNKVKRRRYFSLGRVVGTKSCGFYILKA